MKTLIGEEYTIIRIEIITIRMKTPIGEEYEIIRIEMKSLQFK